MALPAFHERLKPITEGVKVTEDPEGALGYTPDEIRRLQIEADITGERLKLTEQRAARGGDPKKRAQQAASMSRDPTDVPTGEPVVAPAPAAATALVPAPVQAQLPGGGYLLGAASRSPMPWSVKMLVADPSVEYTPTPDPERAYPETETPFEKGRMERMGRSTSRMPEDIPQPPSKRLKVTTPRSTLFEPELVAPPVNRLRAIMENSRHTPLALTGQFRAAVQSRRFQQRAAETGAIGTQLRAAVHSRRFQQRGIQARAAAEAAEKKQRRASTAQEIAGEQQRAMARESKLDRSRKRGRRRNSSSTR